MTFGEHGIWPGVDRYGIDDAARIFWDPDAVGADETGAEGTGLWRFAEQGARYEPDTWPIDLASLADDAITTAPPVPVGDYEPLAGG